MSGAQKSGALELVENMFQIKHLKMYLWQLSEEFVIK